MHLPLAASLLAAAVLFAPGARAQATWIVDQLNRPGTHFLDLPAAVAASTPGDVVMVRYVSPLQGAYTAPTISRALTVIGTGGQPGLVGNLIVQNLPAGETVVLRDLQLAPFVGTSSVGNCSLIVRLDQGTVHIQNVDRDAGANAASILNQWRIEDSVLVTVAQCSVGMVGATGTLVVKNTPLVTMHTSVIQPAAVTTAPTMVVENAQLVLSDSTVLGSGQAAGAVAISALYTSLQLAGSATAVVSLTGGTAVSSAAAGSSVVASSSALLGPVAGVTLLPGVVPALGGRIDGADLLQLSMFGESLGIGVLAVGEPIPAPLPLFGGSLYLDPGQSGVVDLVAFNLAGRGSWQLQLPTTVPSGFAAWMQGVTLGIASGFLLTPPVVVVAP